MTTISGLTSLAAAMPSSTVLKPALSTTWKPAHAKKLDAKFALALSIAKLPYVNIHATGRLLLWL